ncbi:MAG: TatD family hydrolase, partial [Candidatus Uhrbacteria bacterium]|nr:TatD family hydrolase [Candidatus Uhrbacteria bacterium]
MPYRFIDTHCHVHFRAYAEDMDDVVRRSLEAGVGMVTVGTQSSTSKSGLELAEKYEGVWTTIGLHPNHLHAQEFLDENELDPNGAVIPSTVEGSLKIKTRAEKFDPEYYRELAKHPKVVAIGEFGLDYYRIPPNVDVEQMKQDQAEAVRAQLAFATEVDKPVVIHCRDAHADQAQMIRDEIAKGGLARRGVIHCFTGTVEEAATYRELGFLVSITGIVTFGKSVMDMVREVPLEQMMIETDSPYLTPAPNRGKRNEPKNVEFVAAKIAELKGVSIDEVAKVT